MTSPVNDQKLTEQHTSQAIADRIQNVHSHSGLGDLVLGAVDGTVTTFAIVSGVAGTGLQQGVAVAFVLGFANVLADGFSMGVSNYLKARSDLQNVQKFRAIEEMHIETIPESEKEEVRQIFHHKGFREPLLAQIVTVITSDKKLWVDTMLQEEWGLHLSPINPLKSGLLTFGAFIAAGTFPLLPLFFGFQGDLSPEQIFSWSAYLAGGTFLATGALRGWALDQSPLRSALETLLIGGVAAGLAYFVGDSLSGFLID